MISQVRREYILFIAGLSMTLERVADFNENTKNNILTRTATCTPILFEAHRIINTAEGEKCKVSEEKP